jgi:hypothetical protein
MDIAWQHVRDPRRQAAGVDRHWMFPPKSFFFPEYHRPISRPFRLAVFSRHRPPETISPSRITYGAPSFTARSSASSSPGACAEITAEPSAT